MTPAVSQALVCAAHLQVDLLHGGSRRQRGRGTGAPAEGHLVVRKDGGCEVGHIVPAVTLPRYVERLLLEAREAVEEAEQERDGILQALGALQAVSWARRSDEMRWSPFVTNEARQAALEAAAGQRRSAEERRDHGGCVQAAEDTETGGGRVHLTQEKAACALETGESSVCT